MKTNIRILAVFAGVLFSGAVFAETVMIRSLTGDVKVSKTGSGWEQAKTGMKIDDSWFVSVPKNGSVQIQSQAGSLVKVDSMRTAKVTDLFASAVKPGGLSGKLSNLKSKLTAKGDGGYGATAVAGVRGANIAEQNVQQLKKDLYWEE